MFELCFQGTFKASDVDTDRSSEKGVYEDPRVHGYCTGGGDIEVTSGNVIEYYECGGDD